MTAIIMPKFDLPSFLNNIQTYKVTNTFIVPPVALALAKHPMVNDYDLTSLRHIACGAAPLPKDLCEMIEKRLGVYCRQGFGMTEASPLVACIRPGQRMDGSVGPLVAGLTAKVVDTETGMGMDICLVNCIESSPKRHRVLILRLFPYCRAGSQPGGRVVVAWT